MCESKKRILSLVLFDGDCVLEHGLEQISEGHINEYIFARSKYLLLEIRLVMKLIGDEIVIRPNKGGAGKGLFIISESSDLVIYNVARGRKTEVIALFDLDPLKEKKTTSLHYFEL